MIVFFEVDNYQYISYPSIAVGLGWDTIVASYLLLLFVFKSILTWLQYTKNTYALIAAIVLCLTKSIHDIMETIGAQQYINFFFL